MPYPEQTQLQNCGGQKAEADVLWCEARQSNSDKWREKVHQRHVLQHMPRQCSHFSPAKNRFMLEIALHKRAVDRMVPGWIDKQPLQINVWLADIPFSKQQSQTFCDLAAGCVQGTRDFLKGDAKAGVSGRSIGGGARAGGYAIPVAVGFVAHE